MPKRRCKNIVFSIITLLFLGAGLPKMYAGSVLLSKRISIHIQKQPVEKALKAIEKKADVQFMYNPQMFNLKRIVSIQAQNLSIQAILQNIINNKELVMYEMGKYIVITNRHQAPVQAELVTAFPDELKDLKQPQQLTVDTIHFYDTVRVTKTKEIIVQDTVKIYDTVTKIITQVVPQAEPKIEMPQSIVKSHLFAEAAFAPMYIKMLPQPQWMGDLSYSARASIGYSINKCSFSIGVGMLQQRGSSRKQEFKQTVDSVMQSDTIRVMQKYKTGDYFYISGTDTIHKIIYDSTLIIVPQKWYNKTQQSKTTQTIVNYSLVWLTIPCKLSYDWSLSKNIDFRLGVRLSPAIAIKKEGYLYVESLGSCVPISEAGIRSYALFGSFEPELSFRLTNRFSCSFCPILHSSLRSILSSQKATTIGFGGDIGCRISIN